MKTLRVLLANSDRRINNLIEVAVRDVCFNHFSVECAATRRLDELLHRGCSDEFGLIFVVPDHLALGLPPRSPQVTLKDAAQAFSSLKSRRSVPIIAVGAGSQDKIALLEAGADEVFGVLFDRDEIRSEIRRVLKLPAQSDQAEVEPSRSSFALTLARGLQKL